MPRLQTADFGVAYTPAAWLFAAGQVQVPPSAQAASGAPGSRLAAVLARIRGRLHSGADKAAAVCSGSHGGGL